MRYVEIVSGLRIPLSQEEHALLLKAEGGALSNDSLSDRDQEIARRLTSRGGFRRFYDGDGKMNFTANIDPTLRRF